MEKSQFVEIVNKMVDIKIKQILPGLIEKRLQEVLKSDALKSIIQEAIEESGMISMTSLKTALNGNDEAATRRSVPRQSVQETQSSAPVKEKAFVKNPLLNAILNETARTPAPSQRTGMGSAVSSQLMQAYAMAEETGDDSGVETLQFNTMRGMPSMPIPSRGATGGTAELKREALKQEIAQQVGNPEVANLMIKDYSSFMKTVAKKTSEQRSK